MKKTEITLHTSDEKPRNIPDLSLSESVLIVTRAFGTFAAHYHPGTNLWYTLETERTFSDKEIKHWLHLSEVTNA